MTFGSDYNIGCKNYKQVGEVRKCKIKMDMDFCGRTCPFATNMPGSTKSYDAPTLVNGHIEKKMHPK